MQFKFRNILLVAALTLLSAGMLMASEQGTFDRTLNVNGAVTLDISTGSGQINVHSGAGNAVTVHATVKVSDNDWGGGDVHARLQRILNNPPIEQNGNFIRIGRIEDEDLRRNVSISYDVTAPASTRLTSTTGSGGQEISGIAGPLKFTTGSGTLHASNIGAEVDARSGSGGISLNTVNGAVTASTGSGDIVVRGVAGAFDGRTGSGSVKIDQTSPGNVNISTGSGDVTLNNVKGGVRVGTGSGSIHAQGEMASGWSLTTASGSVSVELPKSAGFELSARSSSGRIEVEREITMQGSLSRHEVRGKVGGGGYLLEARTSSGSITVR